jgi:hypothetical protein
MMNLTKIFSALPIAMIALLAACGSDSEDPAGPGITPPAETDASDATGGKADDPRNPDGACEHDCAAVPWPDADAAKWQAAATTGEGWFTYLGQNQRREAVESGSLNSYGETWESVDGKVYRGIYFVASCSGPSPRAVDPNAYADSDWALYAPSVSTAVGPFESKELFDENGQFKEGVSLRSPQDRPQDPRYGAFLTYSDGMLTLTSRLDHSSSGWFSRVRIREEITRIEVENTSPPRLKAANLRVTEQARVFGRTVSEQVVLDGRLEGLYRVQP